MAALPLDSRLSTLDSLLMPPRHRRAPQVHKFGGASLADSTAVHHAVTLIQSFGQEPTVVVVSAMAGVTDALLEVARQAGRGDARGVASLIDQLRSRHNEVARTLLSAGRLRSSIGCAGSVFLR